MQLDMSLFQQTMSKSKFLKAQMEDIIETQEFHENDNESEQDKFLDDSFLLEQNKLLQNNMIIDDK